MTRGGNEPSGGLQRLPPAPVDSYGRGDWEASGGLSSHPPVWAARLSGALCPEAGVNSQLASGLRLDVSIPNCFSAGLPRPGR